MRKRAAMIRKLTLLLGILPVAAGCASSGPVDGPVDRNLKWFSYLGGEDIRKSCSPGAPDVYRFVYNGIYDQQLRSYDLRTLAAGQGAELSAWARGVSQVNRPIALTNLLAPWRGTRANATLGPASTREIIGALSSAGFTSDKPVGLTLPSDAYYWVVTACIGGRFHANAWVYPSERYNQLKIKDILMRKDGTNVAFSGPIPANRRADDPARDGDRFDRGTFLLKLGPDGIIGAKSLF